MPICHLTFTPLLERLSRSREKKKKKKKKGLINTASQPAVTDNGWAAPLSRRRFHQERQESDKMFPVPGFYFSPLPLSVSSSCLQANGRGISKSKQSWLCVIRKRKWKIRRAETKQNHRCASALWIKDLVKVFFFLFLTCWWRRRKWEGGGLNLIFFF